MRYMNYCLYVKKFSKVLINLRSRVAQIKEKYRKYKNNSVFPATYQQKQMNCESVNRLNQFLEVNKKISKNSLYSPRLAMSN